MKRILISLFLCPLTIMAMEESVQDKDIYVGIVTRLINTVSLGGGKKHVSPISENTLIYKTTALEYSSVPLTEFVTSIDDLNPPQVSRSINTSATQYTVYINNIVFEYPYDTAEITFTTTKSKNGTKPKKTKNSLPLCIGESYATPLTYGTQCGIESAEFEKTQDGRLELKSRYPCENKHDIRSTSRREDLERCPSRTVGLMIACLRMNKISTTARDEYIISENQTLELEQ